MEQDVHPPPTMAAGKEHGLEYVMNIEDIRRLIDLMNDNDLMEVELEEEGRKIRLRKKTEMPAPQAVEIRGPSPMSIPVSPKNEAAQPQEPELPSNVVTIHSPMVGTYYHASGPDTEPYVEEGDAVASENVVCIIEAMKVMNEIKAEVTGIVREILVKNGEPVEYDQPLFLIQLGDEAAVSE